MNEKTQGLARRAIKDAQLLSELLEGILSKKDAIRFENFKTLLLLSEEHPEVLYPKWDFFEGLLRSDNTYHKCMGVQTIANLARVDSAKHFERIYDTFYSLLNDKSVVTANYLAGVSGKIAEAKPELQTKITRKLLSIDETHHDPERRDLIKSYAIKSFSEYFKESKDKAEIVKFVEKQLDCKSPKTRKIAKDFLKKCG
jgi:hypothetical protein